MQLFNITQHVKQYLSDKPELLRKYVNVGTVGVYYAVQPLNAVLRHLILVQGLDPNTVPGERERRELAQALNSAFSYHHEKTFDDEPLAYDFSWVAKKIDADRVPLSKEPIGKLDNDYMQPTIGVKSVATNVAVAESPFGTGTTVFATGGNTTLPVEANPVDELAKYFDKSHPVINLSLTESMNILNKYADVLDYEATSDDMFTTEQSPDPKELFARTDYLRDVKQAIRDRYQHGGEEKLKAVVSQDVSELKMCKKTERQIARDAETLSEWVESGRVTASDALQLVNEGLDQKVIDRWQLIRALKLANEMAARGLCDPSKKAIEDQTLEIVKFSEDSFAALKRVVSQHPVKKAPTTKKKSPTVKVVKKSKRGSFNRSSRKS